MPDRRIWRGRIQTFLLVLLPVLLAGAFVVVLRQAWSSNSADARFAGDERSRVAYLRPLTHLVAALTEARSGAVADTQVDTAELQSAVGAVDTADAAYRGVLRTGQRWSDLRARVTAETAHPGQGASALQAFTDTLTLALDLVRRVGDTSDLILDPQLDSYYIMDTAPPTRCASRSPGTTWRRGPRTPVPGSPRASRRPAAPRSARTSPDSSTVSVRR
jgi:hypothetical protein